MLIGAIIAVCIILAILGFLLPRFSEHARKGTDRTLGVGQRTGGKAANKSHSKGKEARSKSPL